MVSWRPDEALTSAVLHAPLFAKSRSSSALHTCPHMRGSVPHLMTSQRRESSSHHSLAQNLERGAYSGQRTVDRSSHRVGHVIRNRYHMRPCNKKRDDGGRFGYLPARSTMCVAYVPLSPDPSFVRACPYLKSLSHFLHKSEMGQRTDAPNNERPSTQHVLGERISGARRAVATRVGN